MNSIWGNGGEDNPEDLTDKVRIVAEGGSARLSEPPRSSRPPINASPEERELYRIFSYLRGREDYAKKSEFAAKVLNGEYGIKNEILAKLMMGPGQFREVLEDRRDIIPPILELIYHREVDVRVKVAKVLAERGDGRVLFDMYGGLEEKEYWARYEFSVALWKIARRLTDVEAVAEIREFMEDRAKRPELDGIAPALLLVKMHLNRLRSPDDDKKSVPPALRQPPMAVVRDAFGRPDTSVQAAGGRPGRPENAPGVAAGRGERPDTTMRIAAGRPKRPDTTVRIIKPR